jgi:fumarate reductase subunit D
LFRSVILNKKEELLASFEQHINGSVIVTGVMIIPLYASGILSVNESFLVLLAGVIGGMLPDLDSNSSKPVQATFKIVSIFLPLLLLLSIHKKLSVVEMIYIWVGATILLYATVFKVFMTLTRHRGIFHSIPMGILMAQLTTLGFHYFMGYEMDFAILLGLFVLLGFITHLLLDEIFSIDALGLRLKESFGTAVKFYDKNNLWGTLILYGVIGLIFFNVSFESSVYGKVIKALKQVVFI